MQIPVKESPEIAKEFVVTGRVQGVGYHYFAERWASQCGLIGALRRGDSSISANQQAA